MTDSPLALLADALPVTVRDAGQGRPFLLLHGGAGPGSMQSLADALAASSRAVLPTHPGFEGTPRPEWLHSVPELATAYLALLDKLDLRQVVLVGNSMGGWLAAELALRASPRIQALVLLNAVGLDPTAESGPILDPAALPPAERTRASFYDPAHSPFAAGPPTAALAANQQALRDYAGSPFMHDPTLRARLPQLRLPALVVWGASDRIVALPYGEQFAQLIPHARFEAVAQAGHFPQLEQLATTLELIQAFARESGG